MFSKEAEYAIRALVYVQAKNREGIKPGVEEISNSIDSPKFFTARILHRLGKLGFIGSQKGRNGGFFFDPEKPDLPLKDIITAIDGDKLFTGCGFGLKQCDENNPCPLHNQYALVRDSINQLTASQSIQLLAKNLKMGTILTSIGH